MSDFSETTPILLHNGTISGSLSSLESPSAIVIGSVTDPHDLEEFWLSFDEILLTEVLEVALEVTITGVSGIESEVDSAVIIYYIYTKSCKPITTDKIADTQMRVNQFSEKIKVSTQTSQHTVATE